MLGPGNPFPFVPLPGEVSCLFCVALELNPGSEAVGCIFLVTVPCFYLRSWDMRCL